MGTISILSGSAVAVARHKAANNTTPVRLKVSLTAVQHTRLTEKAKARGVSLATIVRELLDASLGTL